jgi:hypothetical protein
MTDYLVYVAAIVLSALAGRWLFYRLIQHIYDNGGAKDVVLILRALRRERPQAPRRPPDPPPKDVKRLE